MAKLLTGIDADPSDTELFVIQVNLTHRVKRIEQLGSVQVWKIKDRFGISDDLMFFCQEHGCLGLHDPTFVFKDRDTEVIQALEDELGATPTVSQWPKGLRDRYNGHWSAHVMCPICSNMAVREDLPDTYNFQMPYSAIAVLLAEFYRGLSSSAHIFLTRHKENGGFQRAIDVFRDELHSYSEYEKLRETARDREFGFYANQVIQIDLEHGRDLSKCIEAFLRA